ncbi:MAG: PilZ domain-containing protein [Candidatus Acidiferrales bacterium]
MSAAKNGNGHAKNWNAARLAPRFSSLRELSVTYEGFSEDILTRPPDVSARGMFINTNRKFPEGAVLIVQFRLALTGVEIRSRCEVRYCLPGVGVGVEFIEISPESVRAIEEEVKLGNRPAPRRKSSRRTKLRD